MGQMARKPTTKSGQPHTMPSSLRLLSKVVNVHLPDVVETSRPWTLWMASMRWTWVDRLQCHRRVRPPTCSLSRRRSNRGFPPHLRQPPGQQPGMERPQLCRPQRRPRSTTAASWRSNSDLAPNGHHLRPQPRRARRTTTTWTKTDRWRSYWKQEREPQHD